MSSAPEILHAARASHRSGRIQEAESLYRRALGLDPRSAEAYHGLGTLLLQTGRAEQAVDALGQAVAFAPSSPAYHLDLGDALRRVRRLAEAQVCYERAQALDPPHPAALSSLGIVHHEQGRLAEAEACFRRAVQLAPDDPSLLSNLGAILLLRGGLDEAHACLERAVGLRPDYPQALLNLGAVAIRLGRYDEAQARLERAVQLAPNDPVARHNFGVALHKNGRLGDAEAILREAIRIKPDYAPAHFALGCVLKDALRLDEAQASLERALGLRADAAEVLSTLATVLAWQGRVADARATLGRLGEIRPGDGLRIRQALTLPVVYESAGQLRDERRRLEEALERLSGQTLAIRDPVEEVGLTPFFLAYQGGDDRSLHERLARIFLAACPELGFVAPHCRDASNRAASGGPIRVGFLSTFFYRHTIGKLNAGFVRGLSRERFSVVLLRFPGPDDGLARSLQASADRVVTLPRKLDEARRRIAEERLDVLYYPEIGMDPLTYFLAFARLAPVQCVGWGHPVTTGIPAVDAFLSCAPAEPVDAEAHYTERLVHMRKVNTSYDEPTLSGPPKTRRDSGLGDVEHLYACTQSLFKVHPDMDAALGAILRRDPRGTIVFLAGMHPHWSEILAARLRLAIPDVADRIRFLPPLSQDDFLRFQAVADVLLDTFPFGGGNTCYEAFAFGTPVVTYPGRFLRGRLARALSEQMGVLDGVAATPEDYVAIAVRLGTDAAWREEVRGRILAHKHRLYRDAEAVAEFEQFLGGAVGRPPAVRPA